MCIRDRYPIRLIFDDSDPLNYVINVPEQEAFKDSNYGTIYLRSVEMLSLIHIFSLIVNLF